MAKEVSMSILAVYSKNLFTIFPSLKKCTIIIIYLESHN